MVVLCIVAVIIPLGYCIFVLPYKCQHKWEIYKEGEIASQKNGKTVIGGYYVVSKCAKCHKLKDSIVR